ncbi:hypothetical protein [Pseudoalteromonas sp.]|uniref:hypothetical protein n=1 Tax=Pseudoalteromonas sp. TaxID=53249 RepID=UPI001BCAD6B7|nr:hypothetical protein [Pseudoalteromonas sp.]
MNKKELLHLLKSEGFKKEGYSLEGSSLFEGHCLDYRDGLWAVYYFERGIEFELEEFDIEEQACQRIYEKIKTDPFMKR